MQTISPISKTLCTAFDGDKAIASGELWHVAKQLKENVEGLERGLIQIFDDSNGKVVDVDFRGSVEEVLERLGPLPSDEPVVAPGPGRPKLGVVAREVTLLPRHWEWLSSQPGGASVALRKLVEEARKANVSKDRQRENKESAYRFMYAMAGDRDNFEEASRALFAWDLDRLKELTATWPKDVREYVYKLATAE